MSEKLASRARKVGRMLAFACPAAVIVAVSDTPSPSRRSS
jgi:hypothetical protein